MSLIKQVVTEIVGMFVGDARLSLVVLAVIAAAAAAVSSGLPPLAGGAILLLGSLAVLFDSVRRASRPRG